VSGRIDHSLFSLIVLTSVGAAAFDLARSKIPNFITFTGIILGLTFGFIRGGWLGLGDSFLGVSLALLFTGWMYLFGGLGAGDIKLYMALGALGGWRYGLEVVIVSLLVGGLVALVVLGVRGQLFRFLYQIYRFLLTRIVRELEPEPLLLGNLNTFPFGLPIGVAAIWCSVDEPLRWIGWRLW